jgi:hypothetical protein
MTCKSALERMLDAEPYELDADGVTPLGAHLRDCVRCRGVASRLVQDTLLLAHMLPVARVRRPARRAASTIVPVFVLAAIVMAVMLRSRSDDPRTLTTSPVQTAGAVVHASVPSAASPAPNAAASPRRVARARQASFRAFAPAVAVAPVRFEPVASQSSVTVSPGTVTVTPPAGTRATVMQTSNPKLVVVWLY